MDCKTPFSQWPTEGAKIVTANQDSLSGKLIQRRKLSNVMFYAMITKEAEDIWSILA